MADLFDASKDDDVELEKSNVLLLGPTGVRLVTTTRYIAEYYQKGVQMTDLRLILCHAWCRSACLLGPSHDMLPSSLVVRIVSIMLGHAASAFLHGQVLSGHAC